MCVCVGVGVWPVPVCVACSSPTPHAITLGAIRVVAADDVINLRASVQRITTQPAPSSVCKVHTHNTHASPARLNDPHYKYIFPGDTTNTNRTGQN